MTFEAEELGIVADDLTGACDVAACFAPLAGEVEVAISPDLQPGAGGTLQVINTQSRLKDCESACRLLRQVGAAFVSKKFVFKKIDAGLRGPLGAEIAGLLAGLAGARKEWTCVVAPAIPSIGRTTRGGIQYDHGKPIHEGGLSHDPHSPPASADVRQVIRQTGGGDFPVADAESDDDLNRVVAAPLEKERVVFAGSLGLAKALARMMQVEYHKPEAGPPARRPVMVCGSRHPRSSLQVEQARRDGIRVVSFDPVRRRLEALDADGKGPLLARILPIDAVESSPVEGTLLDSFTESVQRMLEQFKADGLAVMGGETAYHLLRRLGARGLRVLRQDAQVIASSRIEGGALDGCRFVSKGGSVGPDDAARRMLALLTASGEAGS